MPRSTLVALGAAILIAACEADEVTTPEPPEFPEAPLPDAKIEMAAHIDGRTYTARVPAGFTVAQIEINKGGIRVSATFRNAGDRAEAGINGATYQLTVAGSAAGDPLPSRVEFTRTDAFSGTLYWIAPGQELDLWLGLLHEPTGQHVLGPFPIGVRRRSHDGSEAVELRVRQASSE